MIEFRPRYERGIARNIGKQKISVLSSCIHKTDIQDKIGRDYTSRRYTLKMLNSLRLKRLSKSMFFGYSQGNIFCLSPD